MDRLNNITGRSNVHAVGEIFRFKTAGRIAMTIKPRRPQVNQ